MTVADFTINVIDGMFRLIDANKTGYLSNPFIMYRGR